mgnify:FL=1
MKDDDLDLTNRMDEPNEFGAASETAATNLILLSRRIDQLLTRCERLAQENQTLRDQHDALQAERDALRDNYEHSRARIDAMIVRLKGLEQNP